MQPSDPAALAEQYADAGNLGARVRFHERHGTADRGWWQWVLDRVDLPGAPTSSNPAVVRAISGGTPAGVPAGATPLLTDFSRGVVTERARRSRGRASRPVSRPLSPSHCRWLTTASTPSSPTTCCITSTVTPRSRGYGATSGRAALRDDQRRRGPWRNCASLGAVGGFEPPSVAAFSLENGGE